MLPIPAYVRRGKRGNLRRESDNRGPAARHGTHDRGCLGMGRQTKAPALAPKWRVS